MIFSCIVVFFSRLKIEEGKNYLSHQNTTKNVVCYSDNELNAA